MFSRRWLPVVFLLSAAAVFALSCSKKDEGSKQEVPGKEEERISYISEDINFGIYFDEEGTQRVIKLEKNVKELKVYIIVHFPEYMEINAVEYRLELPKGVTLGSDKFYEKRSATLGTFEHGISEAFPCVPGPKLLLHTLTLELEGELKNAVLSIMPHHKSEQVAVAKCKTDYPEVVKGASYRAVINPEE